MTHKYYLVFCITVLFFGCKAPKDNITPKTTNSSVLSIETDLTIALGSCNNQNITNLLWDDVLVNKPEVWIWGGDNVYSDTKNMTKLKADYNQLFNDEGYSLLRKQAQILGTWDDHDYGLNDGGFEFTAKEESQQEFLDFMGVSKTDLRRARKGVYHSEMITTDKGSVKIIVLDTRYFRSKLVKDTKSKKSYKPTKDKNTTILGNAQWQWLTKELQNSNADFNVIVSSIQFLSNEHGFETWGNFPHEVETLKTVIINSKAKGVLLLSGDRHISEFSKTSLDGLSYPLIDFTSSGLTHAYSNFTSEPNPYRVGDVVSQISFGVLKFDFENRSISMEMRGDGNELLQELSQQY